MTMEEEKIQKWIKKNKKKLIISGCGIILSVVAYKYRDEITNFTLKLFNGFNNINIEKMTTSNIVIYNQESIRSINVNEHIRNLPKGFHPSLEQLNLAKNRGILLTDSQTFVSGHIRCYNT